MESVTTLKFSPLAEETLPTPLTDIEAFTQFACRSLTDLLDFGQEATRLLKSCSTLSAKNAFWEQSEQQYSKKFVEKAISLWQWWSQLPEALQQQIQPLNLAYWPLSTAISLMKVGERLGEFLDKLTDREKVTASQIEQLARKFTPKRPSPLRLGKLASDEDWDYVADKLALGSDELEALQQKASELADIEPNTESALITTDKIIDTLESSGFDANLVLYKLHRPVRQLAAKEEELALETQLRLAAQGEVQETYAELQAAQEEIAQLREQLIEVQRHSSSTHVSKTSSTIAEESQIQEPSPTITEAAKQTNPPVKKTIVTVSLDNKMEVKEEYESQKLTDITSIVFGTEKGANGGLTDTNLFPNQKIAESASNILPSKSNHHSHPKRKRRRTNFLTEMSRLG